MEKDKLEPKLRFPGFTEPWEHRKLATIATFAKGRGYSKNDLTDRGTPLILYGRLYTNYSSAIETVDTYAKPLIGSVYSKGGEVIVPASGETAEDIARASAVISKGFLLGGDLNIINPNSEIDPVFLALQLSNGYLKKELASKAQGKSVVHIHNSDLENLQIIYPSLVEQMKVSTCIRMFDHLITLHQRKEEELQKLKKGLLQKMFPKDGESVPEVRFPNFTNTWEHRKLGNISKKCIVKNTNKAITETFTNSAEHGIVSQRDFFDKDIANQENISSYYVVNIDDFVYNPRISSSAPCGPISRNKLGRQGIMSPLYTVFSPSGVDLAFLEQYFKTSRWYSYMYLNGDTGARADRFAIKDKSFFDMPIATPSSLNEQEIISTFLDQTDYRITLHHRKTEELKKLKKALLQQMFV